MAEHDLTGIWQGLYSYGDLGRQIGFTATLIDAGGPLYGTTHESDPQLAPTSLEASLSGRRAALRVSFVKTYAAAGPGFPPIAYDGRLSSDGLEVEGRWSIRAGAPLAGRFLMSRPGRHAATHEARRTVEA